MQASSLSVWRFFTRALCLALLSTKVCLTSASDADWISKVIRRVEEGYVSNGAGREHIEDYPEESIEAFIKANVKGGQKYIPILQELGVDWSGLEASIDTEGAKEQEMMTALYLCRAVLRQARLRRAHRSHRVHRTSGHLRGSIASSPGEDDGLAEKIDGLDRDLAGVKTSLSLQISALKDEITHRIDKIGTASGASSGSAVSVTPKTVHAIPAGAIQISALHAVEREKEKEKVSDTVEGAGRTGTEATGGEDGIIELQSTDDIVNLKRAAELVNDRNRIVMLTSFGLNWALTVLNEVYFLRKYDFDGVLGIFGSREECEAIMRQEVVKLKVCTFISVGKFLDSDNAWPANRLRWLEQLAFMGYEVLMTDTDICFVSNPFIGLEASGKNIVTSGAVSNFNLGALYANGASTRADKDRDLGMLTEINKRLSQMTQDFKNAPKGSVSIAVLNDQSMVNDVMQQWISDRPMYMRSCGHVDAKDGYCFNHCCDPDQMELSANETAAQQRIKEEMAEYRQMNAANEIGILMADLGHCASEKHPSGKCRDIEINESMKGKYCSEFGVIHMNTCMTKYKWQPDGDFDSADPEKAGHHNHFNFLRDNCWYSELTELSKTWLTACANPDCEKEHPGMKMDNRLGRDIYAYDDM